MKRGPDASQYNGEGPGRGAKGRQVCARCVPAGASWCGSKTLAGGASQRTYTHAPCMCTRLLVFLVSCLPLPSPLPWPLPFPLLLNLLTLYQLPVSLTTAPTCLPLPAPACPCLPLQTTLWVMWSGSTRRQLRTRRCAASEPAHLAPSLPLPHAGPLQADGRQHAVVGWLLCGNAGHWLQGPLCPTSPHACCSVLASVAGWRGSMAAVDQSNTISCSPAAAVLMHTSRHSTAQPQKHQRDHPNVLILMPNLSAISDFEGAFPCHAPTWVFYATAAWSQTTVFNAPTPCFITTPPCSPKSANFEPDWPLGALPNANTTSQRRL